jgi:hypothetical protein
MVAEALRHDRAAGQLVHADREAEGDQGQGPARVLRNHPVHVARPVGELVQKLDRRQWRIMPHGKC